MSWMRSSAFFLATIVMVVAASCATQVSEVRTNSGGALDCSSDTILYAAINPVPDAAASLPADALMLLGDDLVPPGTPEMESESSNEAVFVYRDSDGYRRARVIVEQRDDAGWLPMQTERCG